MDSQVTRSRQRILESAVSLLRQDGLSGQLVESGASCVCRSACGGSPFSCEKISFLC